MGADDLALCITKPLAAMLWNMHNSLVFVFHGEGFQFPEMIIMQINFHIPKKNQPMWLSRNKWSTKPMRYANDTINFKQLISSSQINPQAQWLCQ